MSIFRSYLRPKHKILFASLLFALPVFILTAIYIINTTDYRNSDFFTFWLAGRMNWTHENPYLADQWIANHKIYGLTYIPNPIFPYPLPLGILFAPLGLLPLKSAFIVWLIVCQFFFAGSVYLLLDPVLGEKRGVHLLLPILIAVVVSRSTVTTLLYGQFGPFLLFMSCLTIYFWQKARWWQGAIALSCLFLKPTIGLPVAVIVLVWLFLRRQIRPILYTITSGIGWILIGVFEDPNWIASFLTIGNQKLLNTIGYAPNIWGLSGVVCKLGTSCTIVVGAIFTLIVLLIAGYVLLSRHDISILGIFSLATCAALILTPYIWAYDHILLIVPVTFIVLCFFKRGYPYIVLALFPLAVSFFAFGLVFLAVALDQDTGSVMLPLICFALVIRELLLPLPQSSQNASVIQSEA